MATKCMSSAAVAAILIGAGFADPAFACGGFICDTVRNVGNAGQKAVQDVGHTAEKAAHDVGNTGQTAVQDVGHTTEKAAHDVGNTGQTAVQDVGHTTEKAAHDIGNTGQKAVQDSGKTIEKAVQDTGKAGETVYTFGVREIQGIGDSISDADKRLKEGKFVDAVWHFATDPLKHTEVNAGKAAQESDLVRVAGQIAASAYGGPGGAAAYAAWLTYTQTKDVGLALRVGAITGAAAYATGAVGKIPNTNAAGAIQSGAIAEKTIMAGAIGGVAVAAAGGDKQALQEGFLKDGGAMLVQSIYEVETKHPLDARASQDRLLDTGISLRRRFIN